MSANLIGMFLSKLPQSRHPERSASQIYRVTQRSVARSRRTPAVLVLPMLLGVFRPPKPENRICCSQVLGPRPQEKIVAGPPGVVSGG